MSGEFHSPAFADHEREEQAGRFGIWILIAAEAMMFGGILAVYWILRLHYGEPFAGASAELSLPLGALNTAILMTSSLAMAYAVQAIEPPTLHHPRLALLLTAGLGLAFLLVKASEYLDEARRGLLSIFGGAFLYHGDDPQHAALFFDLYIVLTGLHAIHLLVGIGLVLWLVISWHTTSGPVRHARLGTVGLYWHFVDVVWVFLFPLLYLVS